MIYDRPSADAAIDQGDLIDGCPVLDLKDYRPGQGLGRYLGLHRPAAAVRDGVRRRSHSPCPLPAITRGRRSSEGVEARRRRDVGEESPGLTGIRSKPPRPRATRRAATAWPGGRSTTARPAGRPGSPAGPPAGPPALRPRGRRPWGLR